MTLPSLLTGHILVRNHATMALVARLHSYTIVYFRVLEDRTTSECSQYVEWSCRVSFAFNLFVFTRMLVNS